MRTLLFFLCIAFSNSSLIERFENWVTEFKVKFDDYKTYDGVFKKWVANHKFIEDVNSKNLTYKLGHNQFSGMDSSDFSQYLGISRILYQDYKQLFHVNKPIDTVEKVPETVNWVTAELLKSKTKDSVAHVGHSPQLVHLREHFSLRILICKVSQNNS